MPTNCFNFFDHLVRLVLKGLSVLTRKKHSQMKIQRLRKVWILHVGSWYIKTTLYKRFLIWKKNFKKTPQKTVTDKTLIFVWQVPFVLPIIFVLILVSDRTGLYGNDAFLILRLSTKKRYSSFYKNVFFIQKICCKVKVMKTPKVLIVTWTHADFSNKGLFWNP